MDMNLVRMAIGILGVVFGARAVLQTQANSALMGEEGKRVFGPINRFLMGVGYAGIILGVWLLLICAWAWLGR